MEHSAYTKKLKFRDLQVPASERTREQLIQDFEAMLSYVESIAAMAITSAPITDVEGNTTLHEVNNGAVLAKKMREIFYQLIQEDSFRSDYNAMFKIE